MKYFYLEGDEESDGLDAVVASVHIVAHEQVVGVGRLAPDPEQLHQVVELAVHVPAHCHRAFHLQRMTAIMLCPNTLHKDRGCSGHLEEYNGDKHIGGRRMRIVQMNLTYK